VDVQPDPAQNKALFWHEELLCEELPLSAFFSGAALHTHKRVRLDRPSQVSGCGATRCHI
jgi:hypothetical protein